MNVGHGLLVAGALLALAACDAATDGGGGAGGSGAGGDGGSAAGGDGGGAGGSIEPTCPNVCDHMIACVAGDRDDCIRTCEENRAPRPTEVAVCAACLLAASCEEILGGACAVTCEAMEGCQDGEVLDANQECRQPCAEIEVCYPDGGYCGSDGFCHPVTAGSETNDCAGALAAPAMDPSGPLLFVPTQRHLGGTIEEQCRKDPVACTNNGNVCGWTFYFFDPERNLPADRGALYSRSFFVDDAGRRGPVFDVDAPDLAEGSVTIYGCFDEQALVVYSVVQLLDETDLASNALCLRGTTP